MKMDGWLVALLAAAAVYGFMNGWGAPFGVCPPGYTAAGGDCTNTFLSNDPPATPAMPTTAATPPLTWMWNGSAWVLSTPTPSWP